jgi:4-amino-4-deoxy-L-arabinose transferase-like glycosyltransferase
MKNTRLQALVLLAVSGLMFWWRLGHLGLIDPDETFYAQTTREMVERDDWVTPHIFGKPQFEKPILFYWQTMVSQKIFGDNELAARVPSALFATALVFLIWAFGRRTLGDRAGFLAALIFATGMLNVFMARLMLTDISLAFFVTAALYGMWMAAHDEARRDRWVFFQFVMSGLATLTKGPIGVLLPAFGGLAFLRLTKTPSPLRGRGLWLGLAAWLVIVVPWYAVTFANYGYEFWEEFFYRDNWLRLITAEHPRMNQLFGVNVSGIHFYPEMLLLGMLPWMPLAAAAAVRAWRAAKESRGVLFVVCALVPSLVFLTIAQSKLPSYGFFLFPPFALLMGHTLDRWLESGLGGRGERWLAGVFALVQTAGIVVPPLVKPDDFGHVIGWACVIAAPLAVAAALLLLGRVRAWAFATVAASVTIIALAFTALKPHIEDRASSRDISALLRAERRAGEPVVTVKHMVRAVAYYNRETPAAVVSYLRQPWFSPHPIDVLVGGDELLAFAVKHGSVLCVAQEKDLSWIAPAGSALTGHYEIVAHDGGTHIVFRVTPPAVPRVAAAN